jgi:predicted TPR repeat methyltransferase
MRPLLKPTVVLCPGDDGYLAYDTASEKLHRLNPLASLIAELADGRRTQDEILNAVVPLLGERSVTGCIEWMAHALATGLLVDAARAPQLPAAMSGDQLHKLAAGLRYRNCVLAAFVCESRAAELNPDDPQTWYQLGELAHIVGRRVEARAAYERYQSAHPDDAEIEHLLIALRDEAPPARVSDRCIEQLYGHFASYYDQNMCGDLDYRAPDLLLAALTAGLESRRDLVTLDVGCGTGLFGLRIRPFTSRLIGIDLSAAMIERARERGLYNHLDVAELTEWLGRPPAEQFDLIAICDTLIYFGDLGGVLLNARQHLAPAGRIGFTVEKGTTPPFQLTDSGRFTHHRDHLLSAASAAGYRVVSQTEEVLRYEYGEPVSGWVTVLAGRGA